MAFLFYRKAELSAVGLIDVFAVSAVLPSY